MSVIDFCSPHSPSLREIIPNMNVSEYIRGKFKKENYFHDFRCQRFKPYTTWLSQLRVQEQNTVAWAAFLENRNLIISISSKGLKFMVSMYTL